MSVSSAIIVVRRHLSGVGPTTPLAGAPMVARLLHALADAGIRQAILYGDLTPEEASAVLTEDVEERVEVQLARVRPGETEVLAMRRLVGAASGPVLLVPGDLWVDASVFETIASQAEPPVPQLVLSEDGYTGLAVVDLRTVERLGDSLGYIDDLAAMAERGEAHILAARGSVSRLWEAQDVKRAAGRLTDHALALPGEPRLVQALLGPIRRELLPITLQGRTTPAALAVVGTAVGLAAVAGASLGEQPFNALGIVALLFYSAASAIEVPLQRALKHLPPSRTWHPLARHAAIMGAIIAALAARQHALTPGSLAVLVGGAAALQAWLAAAWVQAAWTSQRPPTPLDLFESPHADAPLRAVASLRWLLRPPLPGLALAVAWAAGAFEAALWSAAVCAGISVWALALAWAAARHVRNRVLWPAPGAEEPSWLQMPEAEYAAEERPAPRSRGKSAQAALLDQRARVSTSPEPALRGGPRLAPAEPEMAEDAPSIDPLDAIDDLDDLDDDEPIGETREVD